MRKKSKILLILCFAIAFNCQSQIEANFEDINIHGIAAHDQAFLALQSSYYYGSNQITNEFISSLYQGMFIDSSLKKAVYEGLSEKNKLGGEFNFSISGKLKPHYKTAAAAVSSRTSYWVKAGGRDLAAFTFSDDLFKLIFDGNSQYAGQSIDLGNSNLTSLQYQYIGFGIEKGFSMLTEDGEKNEDEYSVYGAGISFIKGSDHIQMKMDKAILYTQEDGEYIDLDLIYDLKQSDTGHTNYAAFNGFGAGIDMYYRIFTKNKSQLSLSISDVGFIRWDNNSLQSSSDTTYHFEGIEITNIFELLDTTASEQNFEDTLVNEFIPQTQKKSYTSILPAQLHLHYIMPIGATKFFVSGGIKYMYMPGFPPKFYVGCEWYSKSFDVITSVAYGGYTTLSWDLRLRKTFLKTFDIYAGINNVFGYILPAKTTAQGAYLALSKRF
jgi:hypothetical protein